MVSIKNTRYLQIGPHNPEDYKYDIWTRPSRELRRDLYDASWLEPHPQPEPRPQPPRGQEHLQTTYNMFAYYDYNSDAPRGYKRVKITREQYKNITDHDQDYIYPFHKMAGDTKDPNMKVEFKYIKKWSMIIRHCMNVRKDIDVPGPDNEQRHHELAGLGVPCDKDGWTPMELLYHEMNENPHYARIFGLRSILQSLQKQKTT